MAVAMLDFVFDSINRLLCIIIWSVISYATVYNSTENTQGVLMLTVNVLLGLHTHFNWQLRLIYLT